MKKLTITLAALCLAIAGSLGQGSSDHILNDVSQSVRVTVAVNKKARIEVLDAVREIVVTPSDSSRGYLDVNDGIRLLVWCNSLEGVEVSAKLHQGIRDPSGRSLPQGLLALKAEKKGGYFAFNGGNLAVYESFGKEKASPLSYSLRLYLPPGSATGLYRLGMTFAATPK